jgi:hypothetical protein
VGAKVAAVLLDEVILANEDRHTCPSDDMTARRATSDIGMLNAKDPLLEVDSSRTLPLLSARESET